MDQTQAQAQQPHPNPKSARNRKLGITLIVVSTIVWASTFLVPFLPLESKVKYFIATGCLVVGEITFYIGGFFLGKELFTKYKRYLNPINWFKKK